RSGPAASLESNRLFNGNSLPDDDDILREILLRLAPQPSSLPRPSAVRKRWRWHVTDAKFLQRFRTRRGKPPLLGVFRAPHLNNVFTPVLDPPDRVPPENLSLGSLSLIWVDRAYPQSRGLPLLDDFSNASCQIIQAEDGDVGLVTLSYPSFQMWQRKVNRHGVATWLLRKTVDVRNLPGLPHQMLERDRGFKTVRGYVEDTDIIFICVDSNVYMVQLKSMQLKRLHEIDNTIDYYYPFASFYTPGIASAGGSDGSEMLDHA
ncbi:hypothetical protein BRADI_2g01203v3, partial [Brachypodium distachyon]